MPGHASIAASRGWLSAQAVDVPDACGRHTVACRPVAFGDVATAHLRTLSERFSAQLVDALRPTTDVAGVHVAEPAAWALYTDAIRGAGAPALALPVQAAGATPDATLLENMTVLVQQVPEPSVFINVLIGLAWWVRASRRAVSSRG